MTCDCIILLRYNNIILNSDCDEDDVVEVQVYWCNLLFHFLTRYYVGINIHD